MLKIIFLSFITLLLFSRATAQKIDTIRLYMTNNGRIVETKDSADFSRIILPPDTAVDKDLFRVFEYYKNGKRKMIATSLTGTNNPVLDGPYINFFPNGKRQSSGQFKSGHPNGTFTNYYPNGNLYNIVRFDLNGPNRNYLGLFFTGQRSAEFIMFDEQIIEERDSTRKIIATNGTGHLLFFDPDFKKIIAEGDIKNDKREGEWKGLVSDSGRFTCTFNKGVLKSGITYFPSGKQYSFTEVMSQPEFSDGSKEFLKFIERNLHYPNDENRKTRGAVNLSFYVETNGTISDVKVEKSLARTLDEEAVRVVSLSPLWIPAAQFGIPYRSHCSVEVIFDKFTP
jgi:TonB family protein